MYGINLKADIRSTESISIFEKLIVSKTHGSSLFFVYSPLGGKLLTHFKLNFSHLKEHKLTHGFYSTRRYELFDNLEKANSDFRNLSEKDQVPSKSNSSKPYTSENFNQNVIKFVKSF